jgi:uncharacterized protein YecE (DUF72 family)
VIYAGTAGWSIPRALGDRFPGEGSHLERYARVLRAAEINSSFHRPHRRDLYEKWARSTPRGFRFSVKLPRTITHDSRLRRVRVPLEAFLDQAAGLGSRLGPLLVQLPPSLAFEAKLALRFFTLLRSLHAGPVACEPRHASWFATDAEALLVEQRIARVAADPAITPTAGEPGGYRGLVYYRLHGAPRRYWSEYPAARVLEWAKALRALPARTPAWCIFDNTAGNAAVPNALALQQAVSSNLGT